MYKTTRFNPSYLICMFQKVVSSEYENNKQYYINKCVDRPSLLHGMWLKTCDRELVAKCVKGIVNQADFWRDLTNRNVGKGKVYKTFR